MSVLPSDIILYGSANMPDDDVGAAGGAIDVSKRVTFSDIAPQGNVQVVSSAAGDTTQTVTVTGRNPAGVLIAEGKVLNGTTPVPMTAQTVWERLLKALKSATAVGDVAVEEVTGDRSNTAQGGAAATASEMAYIDLDVGASAVDDEFKGKVVRITGGTGAGQIRRGIRYVGASKRLFVDRDWAVVPDGTSLFKVSDGMVFEKTPDEVLEIRRPFYNAEADAPGGSARTYHEKIFVKNTHGTLALTATQIIELADPSAKITFGLAATLNDTAQVADRLTAPGGITFNDADKNVATGDLTPGDAQGTWLRLSLAAGDAAEQTSYELRAQGTTT